MIEYKRENDRLILFINTAPEVGLEEMKSGVENLLAKTDLPEEIFIIENTTHSIVRFNPGDIKQVELWVNILAQRFKRIKHALITQSSDATALGLLIMDAIKVKNYYLEVFSTEEAARKWVLSWG